MRAARGEARRRVRCAEAAVCGELDGVVEAVLVEGDRLLHAVRGVADLRRVDDGPGRQRALGDGVSVQQGERIQVGGDFGPARVVAGGEGLADAGRPVAQADVAVPAYGVGEFGEAPLFLGDDERVRGGGVRPGRVVVIVRASRVAACAGGTHRLLLPVAAQFGPRFLGPGRWFLDERAGRGGVDGQEAVDDAGALPEGAGQFAAAGVAGRRHVLE